MLIVEFTTLGIPCLGLKWGPGVQALRRRIKEVARQCGFSDEDQPQVGFARHLGITPRAYRHRFAAA